MKQIQMGLYETGVPSDVEDGERVEVIRNGGPRDGDRISYATVRLESDGSIVLEIEPDDVDEN